MNHPTSNFLKEEFDAIETQTKKRRLIIKIASPTLVILIAIGSGFLYSSFAKKANNIENQERFVKISSQTNKEKTSKKAREKSASQTSNQNISTTTPSSSIVREEQNNQALAQINAQFAQQRRQWVSDASSVLNKFHQIEQLLQFNSSQSQAARVAKIAQAEVIEKQTTREAVSLAILQGNPNPQEASLKKQAAELAQNADLEYFGAILSAKSSNSDSNWQNAGPPGEIVKALIFEAQFAAKIDQVKAQL